MEAPEDLADLRAADETLQAIARGEEELLPLDEAVHERDRHKLRRYDPANLSRAPFSSFGAFSRSASTAPRTTPSAGSLTTSAPWCSQLTYSVASS
jgi:hypothetical protein